ncbi:DUF4185 domain-containing protein [Mucilaginibacter myungsuensis]|uniref:DUF4185 domain-containing protein n=1 Tax=Mucilaginibacter myungsuensis TaxID=649104 RepID=A0A929PY08_9SPHI|nr:DUF4185 domain-containing protein [Mucilaginibacter myungsuensis]MBE9663694.1 DUF4185 domain-containing protein [Mucilaginibacter myungsuensis]MDN3598982.1 DUF4185 domain-containing protein [Mucilaginibacter myungsuensis]
MKQLATVLFLGITLSVTAQKKQKVTDLTTLKYTVEEAPEWSALLKRDNGWFGGDGIYTIPLNGVEHKQASATDKILFLFSDTMVGQVRDNTLVPGFKMIHNSVAELSGSSAEGKMDFYWDKDKEGYAESVFIPRTPKTEKNDYYWLGDGFVNQELNNSIYIFGYRVRNMADGPFGFREVGNTLIKIPQNAKPPYVGQQQQMDTPFFIFHDKDALGSFGAGIYVNTKTAGAPAPDGYIYVYGVDNKTKNLLVSRVLPKEFEQFDKWTFWDGKTWSNEMNKAEKVADWVSNELSVTAMPDGRYALIYQIAGMSKDIGLRIGKTPYGPFGPPIKIWDCSKDLLKKTYLVYNAKAHPSLSKPGELLISYNINSAEFDKDLATDPQLYRPRFIKLKFK